MKLNRWKHEVSISCALLLSSLMLISAEARGDASAAAAASNAAAAVEVTFPAGTVPFRGVTLSGADFGETNLPGVYGFNYTYPTAEEVTYFKSKGMNLIRVSFRWERLQLSLYQALEPRELGRLKSLVEFITGSGMHALLDLHNYGRFHGNLIGSSQVTDAALADFWFRLAAEFKNNQRVWFGLMNEPYGMASETWLSAANAAIAAIRRAGATNLIAVSGNSYSMAQAWHDGWYGTPNATVMLGVSDPANNYVYDVHQYLDSDSSGTSSTCVTSTVGAERLASFTIWLRKHGKRAVLTEFAGANNAVCNEAVRGMLTHIHGNADVWAGWTWFAAGPWWKDHMFSIAPSNGQDKPQMSILLPFLR